MRKKPQTSKKKMSPKTKKIFNIILAVLFTFCLTCFIVGGYIVVDMISTVNGDRIIDLEYYQQNQDQTTIIYAKNDKDEWVELTKLHGEKNRIWVDLEDIPDYMSKAFIAIEDKRFNEHKGVDWFSMTLGIGKSAVQALVSEDKSVRGASTLTQQLIKNLTGENGRYINRKYNELLAALNLEKYYEKDDILEAYLNTIYLSHNCYGVQTAAETYFGKDVSELNLAECAAIAVITQTPAKNDPLWQPENNKNRQEWCLGRMFEDGMITEEEYEEAINYELIFTNSEKYVSDDKDSNDKNIETITDNNIQSYYVDYVIDTVIADLKGLGYSHYEATNMIYSGGLHIYSAVDVEAQKRAENIYAYRAGFPSERVNSSSELTQSAITIMDYSGRIVAMVGGAGEKTQNRSNNRAVSAVRQPGSSIKPLSIYAPAIEENVVTWSSMITNYGVQWKGNIWPENYGGNPGSPDSKVPVQFALEISYNTVPAQILIKSGLGFERSYNYLKDKFHITTYNDAIDGSSPSALVTGGSNGGVTTLGMAAAFATFGNGGKYYEPYCYYEVKDNKGEVILKNEPVAEQVISPETSYIMNQMMQSVFYGPSGTAYGLGVKNFRTFGKTGSSSNNNDRWCAAGTPYYVAAVWYGYDYNKEVTARGNNPAAVIMKSVMDEVHKGLESKSFEKYTDKVVQRTYCRSTGLIAGDGCTSKSSGWYKVSNIPGVCSGCSGGTPKPETPVTPGNPVTPGTPVIPEIPVNPGTPEIPTVPNVPIIPETPTVPNTQPAPATEPVTKPRQTP